MKQEIQANKKTKAQEVMRYTGEFIVGKLAITTVTQVGQIAMNFQQLDPTLTEKQAFKKAYTGGPFNGLTPSLIREGAKGLYKPIFMAESQKMMRNLLPDPYAKYNLLVCVAAGVFAGLGDAFISQPIEIWKMHTITMGKGGEGFFSYIKNSSGLQEVVQKFSKGITPYAMKQSLMMS